MTNFNFLKSIDKDLRKAYREAGNECMVIKNSLIKLACKEANIDGLDEVSDVHKTFYKHMLKHRYNKILKASYDLLRKQK